LAGSDKCTTFYINIHRASSIACRAADARFRHPSDLEDPDLVEKAKECAIWTGILAERTFHKERKKYDYRQDCKTSNRELPVNQREKSIVWVIWLEDQGC
jgi:hypothetical protein